MTKTDPNNLTSDASRFIQIQVQRTKAVLRGGIEGMKGFAQSELMAFLDDTGEPKSPGDCELALGLKSNRIACIVNDLERKQYVERRGDPSDGRKTVLVLTDLGRAELNRQRAAVNKLVESLKEYLGPERFEEHIRLCEEAIEWAERSGKEKNHDQDVQTPQGS